MWHWCFKRIQVNDKVYVAKGRYKGFYGYVTKLGVALIHIALTDGRNVEVVYSKVEELDSDGAPKPSPIYDMTGRELKLGDLVACSRGKSKMEICKLVGDDQALGVTVETIVRNGEKPSPDKYTLNQRVLHNPLEEAIKLPIDDTTVIMWMLKDFDLTMAKTHLSSR